MAFPSNAVSGAPDGRIAKPAQRGVLSRTPSLLIAAQVAPDYNLTPDRNVGGSSPSAITVVIFLVLGNEVVIRCLAVLGEHMVLIHLVLRDHVLDMLLGHLINRVFGFCEAGQTVP